MDEADEKTDDEGDNVSSLVTTKTKAENLPKQVAFIRWLDQHKPSSLNDQFLAEAKRDASGGLDSTNLRSVLTSAAPPAPVQFDKLKERHLERFLHSLTDGPTRGYN